MENSKSKYHKYTFPNLLEEYDNILVPMIQRDYAQGRTDKKATDVRNNLLNDIFSGKKVHFDLVFGSVEKRLVDGKEKRCFIPVDGQQRLTTLFLLYLYGQRQLSLYQELDLSKFTYDTRRAAADYCESITRKEWHYVNKGNVSDVIKDCSWFMDYWAKDPTVEGVLNMLDAIHEKYMQNKTFPDLGNVTFYFFDLESNGLNENLYLKMNSRGKPLTAFENLKAKIEKVLRDDIEIEVKYFPECKATPKGSFKEKWKFFMDRDWTGTFWDKDHPEKYDESITKFIVRFLSGYWAAFGKEEGYKTTADELEPLNIKDNYDDFISFEPLKKVLELEDAFPQLAYALTTITDNSKTKPYWSSDDYKLKVSDKSEYKLLAVVFAYVLFDGDESAMRFAWNMAENYVTGYDSYINFCKRVKEIHNKYNPDLNNAFYRALLNNGFDNPSDQLKEEVDKAKLILDENGALREYEGHCKKEDGSDYNTWEEIIIDAEKYAFFNGAIRFLFPNEGEDWRSFSLKWGNAKMYFDEDGVVEIFKKEAILLRAFLSRIDIKDDWFGYDKEFWRKSLLKVEYRDAVHNLLIADQLELNATCEDWIKDKTLLINLFECKNTWHILADWKGTSVLTRYTYRLSDPASPHDIVALNYSRNIILSSDGIEISEDSIVKGTNYLYGFDVNFAYKNNYFQWAVDNKVYLMRKNDPNIRAEKQPDNYPFDASGINAQDFIDKLDVLAQTLL